MIIFYVFMIPAVIFLQSFFTALEMAFTSINMIKLESLEASGDPHARKLSSLMKKEGLYLGTTLVGINLAVVISSVLATRIFAEYFDPGISPVLAICVMLPLILVFAEIIPKIVARQFPTSIALRTLPILKFCYVLFYPIITIINGIAGLLLAPFRKSLTPRNLTFTKSDIKKLLLLGRETGEVEEDEVELIYNILDFGSKIVGRIMVPMYRVSSISIDDKVENLKKLVSLTGFSRIPVYKGNKNSIVGMVNIYDILYDPDQKDDTKSIGNFIREPILVKKDDGLDIALARLRHRKQPMGMVTDENNNIVGIVTIEDILEEIVGEIEDRE